MPPCSPGTRKTRFRPTCTTGQYRAAAVQNPAWQPTVRLRPTSEGTDPARWRAGHDVVLDAPLSHGSALAQGVLVDDWTDQAARLAIDDEAFARLREWRGRHGAALTIDGVDLSLVWEMELIAEVVLPAVRVVRSLERAFAHAGPQELRCQGIDAELLDCLRGSLDAEVVAEGTVAPPPSYPTLAAGRPNIPWQRRAGAAVARATGLPGHVRGGATVLPYWHLLPVAAELVRTGRPPLVLDPSVLPAIGREALVRAARTGGWLPVPGLAARLRSRRELARALARLPGTGSDPLDRLLHARTVRMLEMRAGDTLATVRARRRAFRHGRVRPAIVPFDSMPDSRMIIAAARTHGVPVMLVQHGFIGEPNDPDKALSDHVAAWSERDAAHAPAHTLAAEVEGTGNPAAPAPSARRAADSACTLVLVQDPTRISARHDARISLRHARTALRALDRARPGTAAILRPHPSVHRPEAFLALATEAPSLDVRLDVSSGIEALIEAADLCVGAVSTATLQAGVAGVPIAFLNLDAVPRLWPFDGVSLPTATDEDELVALIERVLAAPDVEGREAMVEALGVRPDGLERVLALVSRLAGGPPIRR